MRWKRKKIKAYRDGDTRKVKKFLVLPLEIKRETRWLEWATIKQRYHGSAYMCLDESYWEDVKFCK